jgi:hypothetical protein
MKTGFSCDRYSKSCNVPKSCNGIQGKFGFSGVFLFSKKLENRLILTYFKTN